MSTQHVSLRGLWSSILGWLVWLIVGALLVSCVSDRQAEREPPPSTDRASESAIGTTSTIAPGTSSTAIPNQQIPAGSYYLPSELPEGWELTSLRFFSEPFDSSPDVVDSVELVVHRVDGGFGGGGASLKVIRFSGPSAVPVQPLGFGSAEAVEIPGLLDAEIEYDEAVAFGSVVALIDERTSMVLLGDLPRNDLVDIAGAIQLRDRDAFDVDIDLAGWVAEPGGQPGQVYLLGLRGPEGTLEVSLTPGASEASLHSFSSDFERSLDGQVGTGFFAVQRIEEENLEFPSIRWWVPTVGMSAGVGPELDLIVEILDSFVEVDEEAFRSAIGGVAVEMIELDLPDSASPPQQGDSGEPLDPEVLARLVSFVETRVGRQFDQPPTVSVADGEVLRASVPDSSFVSVKLWDLLLALGLVDTNDDRADADGARRDRLRGVCCPVTVIDTGDPLFNEVVIVHELTHGLDTDLGGGNSGSVEAIDPRIALVEGNAHRVAFDYADLLNAEGADIPPPPNLFPADGDPRVPHAVQRILEFPYREGRRFAVDLEDRGGEQAIIDAFANPPASTEQIMNTDAYFSGDQPIVVPAPKVPAGATIRQQGTIGGFLLSLVAESSLGQDSATDLALAWSGDTYILYDLDGETCLEATIVFDDPGTADDAANAFTAVGATADNQARTIDLAVCR